MRILVIGGSGFLGSHVADALTNRNYEVTIGDLKQSKYIKQKQQFVKLDIMNVKQLIKVLKDFDTVYNFAGLADINVALTNPLKTVELNILGNTNILEACRFNNIKRYIYASSAYVFSNKGSFYGISKQASERLIEEYSKSFGLNYTVIRYGSVYGPRADAQNRIYRMIQQAIEDEKITYTGNGDEIREYIHVRDAASLSVEILGDAYINEHLILTGVEKFKYSELLNMIKEIMNNEIEIEYLNSEYSGHYEISPYSLQHPKVGKKIINNPFVDFGQGLLELILESKDNV